MDGVSTWYLHSMTRPYGPILLKALVAAAVFGGVYVLLAPAFNASPEWVCEAPREGSDEPRKCYRMAEYCEGPCVPATSVQCFEHGFVGALDRRLGPDRDCFASGEDCKRAQAKSNESSKTACGPAWE